MPASFTRAPAATCLIVLLLTLLVGCAATYPRTSLVRVKGSFAANVGSGGAIRGQIIEAELEDPWPATVTVHGLDRAREFEKSVKAEKNGYYRLGDLPAGSYRREVMLVGFRPIARDSIAVEAGRVTVVDVVLAVDPEARVMG